MIQTITALKAPNGPVPSTASYHSNGEHRWWHWLKVEFCKHLNSNPGLQMRQIPHPEKPFGDPLHFLSASIKLVLNGLFYFYPSESILQQLKQTGLLQTSLLLTKKYSF